MLCLCVYLCVSRGWGEVFFFLFFLGGEGGGGQRVQYRNKHTYSESLFSFCDNSVTLFIIVSFSATAI